MITAFQQKVFAALTLIPQGKVVTYKILADYLGCNSAQAIGQALKKNPNAPQVPCHRVVKSDLSLGGYAGFVEGEKWQQKKRLLQREGVTFIADKIDRACVYEFK